MLVRELLDELTSRNPQERIGEFRAWHRGSLSLIHLQVLGVLQAEGSQSMGRLAELLAVSVASATGIVSRMEERRLVERRHGVEDRRMVMVHPTRRGHRVLGVMAQHRRRRLSKLIDHLTDTELQALLIGVRALDTARAKLRDESKATTT